MAVRINIGDTANNTNDDEKYMYPTLNVFGIDISHLSNTSQFSVCCIGVFSLYLIYGYLQELIFALEGVKPFGWYLTLVQFLFYVIFALVEFVLRGKPSRRIPLKVYALLGFLTVGTMGLSNASLGYLNYPTQVIFKCCKLIPVLCGGILIQGKTYKLMDFIACLCMSVGLIYFTLADSMMTPSFNLYGILLISLALCADAAIGNYQERHMKACDASNNEVVLYSYSIGLFYILLGQIASSQLLPAVKFFSEYPVETYGYALFFSLTGYLGVSIVLTMVKRFGALITVTATTCRKALTIILSFIFFAKPFTIQYIFAGIIVLFGIYLNIATKNNSNTIDIIKNVLIHKKKNIKYNNQIV